MLSLILTVLLFENIFYVFFFMIFEALPFNSFCLQKKTKPNSSHTQNTNTTFPPPLFPPPLSPPVLGLFFGVLAMEKKSISFRPPSSSSSISASERAFSVHKKLSDNLRRPRGSTLEVPGSHPPGPYHEGHAWAPSDFADNTRQEIVERLSKSQYSLKELVQIAREKDPKAFQKVLSEVVLQQTGAYNKWSTYSVPDLAEEFHTDIQNGLSESQVQLNFEKYGPNTLEEEKSEPVWKLFLSQFYSPVVILLVVAAIVSYGFQEFAEGVVITLIVLLNASLATYMEKSAGDALAKLAKLAAPHTKVIRGGVEMLLESKDVVPGEIVFLDIGESIPADIRVIELIELKTNEAILTGNGVFACKSLPIRTMHIPLAGHIPYKAKGPSFV